MVLIYPTLDRWVALNPDTPARWQVRGSMQAAIQIPGVARPSQTPLFVLPTFLGSEGQEHGQPRDKTWLRNMVTKGSTKPANLCACSDCHGPTQFGRWFETSTAYPIEFEWFYEPYFVAPKSLSNYDERFMVPPP
jgi:hypothetical protein